jgi:hypothetical protein
MAIMLPIWPSSDRSSKTFKMIKKISLHRKDGAIQKQCFSNRINHPTLSLKESDLEAVITEALSVLTIPYKNQTIFNDNIFVQQKYTDQKPVSQYYCCFH